MTPPPRRWRVVEADTTVLVADCDTAEEARAIARASSVLLIVEPPPTEDEQHAGDVIA